MAEAVGVAVEILVLALEQVVALAVIVSSANLVLPPEQITQLPSAVVVALEHLEFLVRQARIAFSQA